MHIETIQPFTNRDLGKSLKIRPFHQLEAHNYV